MAKDFSTMEDSNRSSNPSIHDVSHPTRRTLLRGGLGATVTGLLAPLGLASGAAALSGCATGATDGRSLLGFPVGTPGYGRHRGGAGRLLGTGDCPLGGPGRNVG